MLYGEPFCTIDQILNLKISFNFDIFRHTICIHVRCACVWVRIPVDDFPRTNPRHGRLLSEQNVYEVFRSDILQRFMLANTNTTTGMRTYVGTKLLRQLITKLIIGLRETIFYLLREKYTFLDTI